MSVIKRIIANFFWKIISVEEIINKQAEYRIADCMNGSTTGKDSKFYEEVSVVNLTGDKSKISIGQNTHIRGELLLWPYSGGIEIGNNSFIGTGTIIRAGEKIIIGNNVLIAHNVTIIDSDSHEINYKERNTGFLDMIKSGHPKTKGAVLTSPIIIEDDAWISYNVCILKGVKIGKGAIIGAGSVVTKDIPEFTIVAGNPARVINGLEFK